MNKRDSVRILLLATILVFAQFGSKAVLADTEQLFNETVTVKNLAYFTITRTVDLSNKMNAKLQGSIDVVSGGLVSGGAISVYVMDADGYQQYQKSREMRKAALYSADNVVSQTLNVPISKSGTYHVVLDNEKSLIASSTVRVLLSLSFELPFLSSPLGYAVIGIVVVAVAAAVAFLFMRSRGKGPAGVPTATKVVNAEAVRKNCSFCGALMHERAKVCPACGKQQPS